MYLGYVSLVFLFLWFSLLVPCLLWRYYTSAKICFLDDTSKFFLHYLYLCLQIGTPNCFLPSKIVSTSQILQVCFTRYSDTKSSNCFRVPLKTLRSTRPFMPRTPAASIHLLFNLGLENNLIMVLFRGTNIQKKLRAAAYKTENFPILTRKDSKKRAKNTILFAYMGEKSYLYTEKNMHNE